MELLFGIISGSFLVFGHILYIRDCFRGLIKPQRATWFVIELVTLISIANQFASGATNSLLGFIPVGITAAIIFVISFFKGVGGFNKLDITIVGLSIAGVVIWLVSGEAVASVIATALVAVLAVTPTILKSLKDPNSEGAHSWALSAIGVVFTALAVGEWKFDLLLIPIVWLLLDCLVVVSIWVSSEDKSPRAIFIK